MLQTFDQASESITEVVIESTSQVTPFGQRDAKIVGIYYMRSTVKLTDSIQYSI